MRVGSEVIFFQNASSISSEAARRLAELLRKPLLPVYTAFTQPALHLAAALSQELYENKILPDFTAGRHEQKLFWNSILDSLLSGILVRRPVPSGVLSLTRRFPRTILMNTQTVSTRDKIDTGAC